MPPVRFLADANLDQNIADGVLRRESQIEFEMAGAVLPPRMKDPEVLAVAASLGCVLVSHDVQTMPRHFGVFVMTRSSPGLILVPRAVSVGKAIEELVMIWHTTGADEWVNRMVRLPI